MTTGKEWLMLHHYIKHDGACPRCNTGLQIFWYKFKKRLQRRTK